MNMMKEIDYFKLIRTWLISLSVYVLVLFFYALIMGRSTGNIPGSEILAIVTLLIAGTSILIGFISIIYAIYMKRYIYILHGLTMFILSFLIGIVAIVISLDSVW